MVTTCFRTDFAEIMEVLDKRLNDKGKNWRHIYKVRISSHRCDDTAALGVEGCKTAFLAFGEGITTCISLLRS